MLNASINEELAAAVNVKEGNIVLEIGPGTGSLTNVLVNAGATVLDIEKVVEEDFTRSQMRSHMSSLLQSERPSDGESFFAKDEAALRLVDSSINSSAYRPINIFVNFYSDPEYIAKISRTNFFAQPKVDAAVISFKLKQTEDYPMCPLSEAFSQWFYPVNPGFTLCFPRHIPTLRIKLLHSHIDILYIISVSVEFCIQRKTKNAEKIASAHKLAS